MQQRFLKQFSLSVDSFEKTYSKCPETIEKNPTYKMELLIISGNYKEAYQFIEGLDDSKFKSIYQSKSIYLTFIKGLMFNKANDSLQRDSCFKFIANNIETYLHENPCDVNAILFYIQTMSVFKDKITLLDRIELIQTKSDCSFHFKDFREKILSDYIDGKAYYNIYTPR